MALLQVTWFPHHTAVAAEESRRKVTDAQLQFWVRVPALGIKHNCNGKPNLTHMLEISLASCRERVTCFSSSSPSIHVQ